MLKPANQIIAFSYRSVFVNTEKYTILSHREIRSHRVSHLEHADDFEIIEDGNDDEVRVNCHDCWSDERIGELSPVEIDFSTASQQRYARNVRRNQ